MCPSALSPASTPIPLHPLTSVHPRKPSKAGWGTAAWMFVLALAFLSAPRARAQCTPQITSLSISPDTIVETSTEEATVNVTISCNHDVGGVWVNVADNSNGRLFYYGADYIPAPRTNADVLQVWAGHGMVHNQDRTYTVTVSVGDSSQSAPLTVRANVPALQLSPGLMVGGVGQLANGTITMSAPMRFGQWVGLSSSPISALWYLASGDLYMWSGQKVETFQIGAHAVTSLITFTFTSDFRTNISNTVQLTVVPIGWNPPPTVDPVNLGPCKSCINQVGAPVNLTNGDVWVQQRDYSNPGLGGGLELVRTWNSLWQDAGPPDNLGMFGHSWRANYEERLSFPDSNTVKFWRGDASAWTFTYNSATHTYSLTSPPDERAQLVHDSISATYTLSLADGTARVFNDPGLLTKILDRNGNQTTVAYDSSSRLVQVTDPAGRALNFHYDNPTFPYRVSSVEDATGVVARYTLDDAQRLTQVLYADNSTLHFNYDPSSSILLSVQDTDGKLIESHTYDSQHRGLTSQRAYGADSVTVSYPADGQAQLVDSMGNTTTYGYVTVGGRRFVNSVSGPGCASCGGRGDTALTYDAQGNRTSSTDALGRTTNYTYDSMGNVLSKSVQLDSSTTLTWSYTYNQFQQVLTATDPAGNTTTNTYDAHGNLLSTTTPSPGGVPGSTTSFAYDLKGQLTQVTDPRGGVTTMAYTPAGLIASITDAQGNTTTFQYDARGNRTSSTDALGSITSFTYDVMNRLTGITQPGGAATSFAYDRRGRRTSVADANGQTTAYQYDDADRLVAVTDATGSVTSYQYGTENHLASITDALGRITSFGYDALGRVTQVTFPSTLTERYTYDALGNLLSKTDRKGQTVSYTYDNLDRLTRKQYPDSTGVDYVYDALSRLTQALDATGTYAFGYDNLGRLLGTTTNYSFLSRTLAMSYSYDAASNRLALTNPQGGVTDYAYDSLNRLTGITDFAGRVFGLSYDALGRRTSLTRPNGVNTTYNYDPLSRLLSVLHQAGSATLDGVAYTYDAAGNRTAKTVLPAGLTSTYAYDPTYQLTQVTRSSDAKITERYTYDAVGNRLYSPGAPYTYNESNQMTSREGVPYTYDANGNTTSKTNRDGTTSYAWDFENRLSSVTLPGTGGTVSFKYDPFGRRIQKTSPSGTTVYVYDGDNIVEQLDGSGALVERYTQGPGIDEPLVGQRQPKIFYYEADGLGSITSLTDPTGAVAATYTYDSFGFMTASTGSATNWFRYTARQFDSSTALYYYRARYYDPMTGRFLSEDPTQDENEVDFSALDDGVSLYAYSYNNPLVFNDPMGLRPITSGCEGLRCRRKNFDKQLDRCGKKAKKIKDPAVRECVKKSCDEGVVLCRPVTMWPAGTFSVHALADTPEVGTPSNPVRNFFLFTDRVKDADIGNITVHEFAHGCGWPASHKGPLGKGVPGRSGSIPN